MAFGKHGRVEIDPAGGPADLAIYGGYDPTSWHAATATPPDCLVRGAPEAILAAGTKVKHVLQTSSSMGRRHST